MQPTHHIFESELILGVNLSTSIRMTEQKPSQSINIIGSSLSGNQLGQSNRNQTQIQQVVQSSEKLDISQEKVITLLEELALFLQTANLPKKYQEKALRYLGAAREEAQVEKPDKRFTADSLKKVAAVLKDTDETIETSQKIWDKVQPVFKQLIPWLGVATSFFL